MALYKGTAYAGENPPTLPMPSMPTEKHLAYNVSDYTFNSLMWAFYSGDSLNRHVVPGDLPDPGVLNTNAYSNTPLQALYKAYPGVDMTADIVAKSAPTVAFEQIYDLTDAGYAKLQSQLPADVYGKLKSVVNQSFLTESGFSAALANALGKDPADLYKTIIEQAALILAGVVTHDNQVVLNVVQGGAQIPVITFEVVQTDVLQKFARSAFQVPRKRSDLHSRSFPSSPKPRLSLRRSAASTAATSALFGIWFSNRNMPEY